MYVRQPFLAALWGWVLGSKRASISHAITRGALLLAMSLVAVLWILALVLSAYLLRDNIQRSLEHDTELAASRLSDALNALNQELKGIAAKSIAANALADSEGRDAYLAPFLRETAAARKEIASLCLHSYRGEPIARIGDEPAIPGHADAILAAIQRGGPLVAERHDHDKELILTLVHPVVFKPTGSIQGALGMDVRLIPILERVFGPSPERAIEIADAQGHVLLAWPAHSTEPRISGAARPLSVGVPGEPRLTLFVQAPRELVTRPLLLLTLAFLTTGALVFALTLWGARELGRRLAAPLEELDGIAQKIAVTGRPASRVEDALAMLEETALREVGHLARTLRSMLQALHASQRQLERRVEERTHDLRQSQERYRSVVEGVGEVIFQLDGRLSFSFVNPAWERLTGYPVSETLGRSLLSFVEQTGRDAFRWAIKSRDYGNADGPPVTASFLTRSGSPVWLEVRLQSDCGGSGGISGTATDITRRRRAEDQVRIHAERLDTMFALSPDGIVAFDEHDCLSSANTAFLAMVGLAERDLRSIGEAEFLQRLRLLCEASAPFPEVASERGGDAGRRPALLHLDKPLCRVLQMQIRRSGNGRSARIYYFRDITREFEVDRMKSEFLSTAAHELRTPMASVMGFTELLITRDYDRETQRKVLTTIHGQSKRLTNLLNELLDLARIEARRGKDFRYALTSLREVIEESVTALHMLHHSSSVKVDLPVELPEVMIDAQKIQQALINVLSNACKYSRPGSEIRVEAEFREHGSDFEIGIQVTDHGVGMAPENVARVFERFFRVDTSGAIPGTGLGLSLVKEIVELHCGEVTLESALGKGTRVTLWLPIPNDRLTNSQWRFPVREAEPLYP